MPTSNTSDEHVRALRRELDLAVEQDRARDARPREQKQDVTDREARNAEFIAAYKRVHPSADELRADVATLRGALFDVLASHSGLLPPVIVDRIKAALAETQR